VFNHWVMQTMSRRLLSAVGPILFTVCAITGHAQTNITLPAPIAGTFEDFSSIDEGGDLAAKGWTVSNFTSEINFDPNLDDPTSVSYEDWVVISRDRMLAIAWDSGRRLQVAPGQVVNGTAVTELLQGKFIYAESDVRSGSQVQYLESPNFNCTGQIGVTLVFHSAYEQNQDSLGGVEYSVDNGANWLPVAYLIDGEDVVRDGEGNVDAEATLNNNHGDVATYTDEEGNFFGGTYGSFLKAPISPDLAPYIQARVNDNTIESKRVEVYRLPEADNKATVRLRFIHAGTGSWYWGLDNIGLYAIPPKSPPSRPTVTAPATAPFFSASVTLGGSPFGASDPSQTHGLTVWQVAAEGSGFSAATGLAAPLVQVSSATALTSLPLSLERLFPGQSLLVSAQYQDQFSNKSEFAAPVPMVIGSTFPPLVPGSFEDFESTLEFEVPAGWTAENQSDEGFTYPGWFVATFDTLNGFGARRTQVPDAVNGQSLYGESDTQNGNNIMWITTPEYNLSARSGVWIAFRSNYEQNQDSFGGLEYSTDGGTTWKSIIYMIDLSDIIRLPDGSVDATATLTTTYGDLAKIYLDPEAFIRVDAGQYADFIAARPIEALGPFISGRINDDPVESKRYERFRVAGADGQARVQFRFTHTGTGSWYWGIDDFGVYSESSTPPPTDLRITSVQHVVPVAGGPASVELKWSSVAGKKYTVQSTTTLAAWPALQADINATGTETSYTHANLPAGDTVRFYRVVEQP
jgi:hypothetical protein